MIFDPILKVFIDVCAVCHLYKKTGTKNSMVLLEFRFKVEYWDKAWGLSQDGSRISLILSVAICLCFKLNKEPKLNLLLFSIYSNG